MKWKQLDHRIAWGSRTIGLVPKGPVRLHMVPNEQRTTERVAVQNRQSKNRRVQMRSSDDGHTRRGGVPRTSSVAPTEGGMEGVEGGPRGTGGK